MKNIRFYTIAVLFAHLPTPKRNRCLHFDIGSHVNGVGICSGINFLRLNFIMDLIIIIIILAYFDTL